MFVLAVFTRQLVCHAESLILGGYATARWDYKTTWSVGGGYPIQIKHSTVYVGLKVDHEQFNPETKGQLRLM